MSILLKFLLPLAFILIPSLAHAVNTWEEYTSVNSEYLISVHMATVLDGTNESDRIIVDASVDGCTTSFILTYAKVCVGDDAATMDLEWDEGTDDIILHHQISDGNDPDCAELDLRGQVNRGNVGLAPLTTNPTDVLFTTANVGETTASLFVHVEGWCR